MEEYYVKTIVNKVLLSVFKIEKGIFGVFLRVDKFVFCLGGGDYSRHFPKLSFLNIKLKIKMHKSLYPLEKKNVNHKICISINITTLY